MDNTPTPAGLETLLPVTQADREAAMQTVPDDGSHSSYMMVDAISEGRADDWPLVQAFARHRIASTPSRGGEDRLREAARALLQAADDAAWSANIGTMDAAISNLRAALDGTRGDAGEGGDDVLLIEHLRMKTGYDLEKVAARAADRIEALIATSTGEGLTSGEGDVFVVALALSKANAGTTTYSMSLTWRTGGTEQEAVDAATLYAAKEKPGFGVWEKLVARIPAASPSQPTNASVREADLDDGEWFYPEGDHSSDECRFSPGEVIDYALEGGLKSQVVCIERASSLPAVYAAVRVYTDAEKDERESDDDYDFTLFATADEARAALPTPSVTQPSGGEG